MQCCNEALALGPLPFDAAMAKAVRGYGEIKAGRLDDGIADLSEAVAWFENSRLRYTHARSPCGSPRAISAAATAPPRGR